MRADRIAQSELRALAERITGNHACPALCPGRGRRRSFTTLVAAMPGIGLAVLASIRLERVFMRIRAAHGQATRPPTQTRPPPLAAARAERVFPVDEAPRATINACNLTTSRDLA